MGLFSAILKVGRKKLGDAEEAFDEATIVEQLEQDIRDGKKRLAEADESRISLRASRAAAKRETKEFEAEAEKWKSHAKQFKEAGQEADAKAAFQKYKTFQSKLETSSANLQMLHESITQLDQEINAEKAALEQIAGEVSSIKANQKMLDAQEAISSKLGAGRNSTGSAAESLQRAKAITAKRRDTMQARKSLATDDNLEARAAALGKESDFDSEFDAL